jgi:hypothetical protein
MNFFIVCSGIEIRFLRIREEEAEKNIYSEDIFHGIIIAKCKL